MCTPQAVRDCHFGAPQSAGTVAEWWRGYGYDGLRRACGHNRLMLNVGAVISLGSVPSFEQKFRARSEVSIGAEVQVLGADFCADSVPRGSRFSARCEMHCPCG